MQLSKKETLVELNKIGKNTFDGNSRYRDYRLWRRFFNC